MASYILPETPHLKSRLLSYLLSNGTRNLWLPWDWEYSHGELQVSVQLSEVQVDAWFYIWRRHHMRQHHNQTSNHQLPGTHMHQWYHDPLVLSRTGYFRHSNEDNKANFLTSSITRHSKQVGWYITSSDNNINAESVHKSGVPLQIHTPDILLCRDNILHPSLRH